MALIPLMLLNLQKYVIMIQKYIKNPSVLLNKKHSTHSTKKFLRLSSYCVLLLTKDD